MSLFKKNKKVKLEQNEQKYVNQADDGWMREDFILVSNKTKAKDLKPYQRLVVLRKPDGEQKCIIDKSLPFSEIERIQEIIHTKGFVNINSKEFTRIIPNDFKTSSDVFDEPKDSIEASASTIKTVDSSEFSSYLVDPSSTPKSILKMEENDFKISLKGNASLKSTKVDDTDLIDDIQIYIPHEDRKLRWDVIDEKDFALNKSQQLSEVKRAQLQEDNFDELPSSNDILLEETTTETVVETYDYPLEEQVDQQENIEEEIIEDSFQYMEPTENPEDITSTFDPSYNSDNEQPELLLNQENEVYSDELTTENIHHDIPKETVTSFFKNEIEYDSSVYNVNQRQPSGNYYRFYEDSNTNPIESKVVNKKAKMIIRRRKINDRLIEANALKRQGLR